MTNFRQQRSERLEHLLEAKNPNWIFGEVSPYCGDFWSRLDQQVRVATKDLLCEASKELPELPAWVVLANIWAVAVQHPVWLALIARAVDGSRDQRLLRERSRLVRLSDDSLRQDACAWAILHLDPSSSEEPPYLGEEAVLMPGLRLRYALANEWALEASTLGLLETACNQPKVSTFVRARELMYAMEAVRPDGRRLPALSQEEFDSAPPRMQAVAIARHELKACILPAALADDPELVARVETARQAARDAKQTLRALRDCLRAQDFAGAEVLLDDVSIDVATCDQAKVVLARLGPVSEPDISDDSPVEWDSLSKKASRRLRRLAPDLDLPPWWRWTASHIAKLIAKKRFSIKGVPAADLARIRRGWGSEEYRWLLAAGRSELVPADSAVWDDLDLPSLCLAAASRSELLNLVVQRIRPMRDARPVLALLGTPNGWSVKASASLALEKGVPGCRATDWRSWVVKCIGTPEWHANADVAGAGIDAVRAGVELLKARRAPVDRDGFRRAMCSILGTKQGVSPGEEVLASFLRVDPGAIPELMHLVPPARLVDMVRAQEMTPILLSRIEESAPAELREPIWSVRLLRARSASRLRSLMLEHPDRLGALPYNPDWWELPGRVADRALTLVLASVGDPERLRSVGERVGEVALRKALMAAARLLPLKLRRDRGYLQLAAVLGSSHFRSLRSVLFLSEKSAPAGCKFDRCYHEYLLPKKSGGNRVISVPPRTLKWVQRAILKKLIAPLGAHEAAFGFVPKRSIRDNASVHVGQEVVSNADVQNCFPSITWSLVLGVLRRDLGQQLGPEAISLLVDICTSKGGLPIGVPTSPALLNRVLLRTDELVQRAATLRECHYTRYADDLTFSGDHRAVEMLGIAKRTLSQIGLSLDPKKTTIYRPGRRQMVTGLVVNQQVSIPRRIRRRMRAAVHAMEQGGKSHWHGQESSPAALMGRLAFLGQIHPEQGGRLKSRLLSAQATKEQPSDG